MIYIETLDRYWDAGKVIGKDIPKSVLLEFQLWIAGIYVQFIKDSIDEQRYRAKWQNLTPGYLAYKRKHGLSTKIWIATGQLRDSLKVLKRKGSSDLVIGFNKNSRHKGGSKPKLLSLSQWLEYGTLRMPPRPLFRLAFIYISKNAGRFYKLFMRNRGVQV